MEPLWKEVTEVGGTTMEVPGQEVWQSFPPCRPQLTGKYLPIISRHRARASPVLPWRSK